MSSYVQKLEERFDTEEEARDRPEPRELMMELEAFLRSERSSDTEEPELPEAGDSNLRSERSPDSQDPESPEAGDSNDDEEEEIRS